MSLVIFLLISAYVLGQTSADTPQQCHQGDPDFNDCLTKLIERGILVMVKEDPRLNISGTDMYLREPQVFTGSVENLITGTVLVKNMYIKNAGKFKVEDARINFDNLVFDLGIHFPKVSFKTDFKIDAKVVEFQVDTAGSLKGSAADLRLHCKVQLGIVERKGVKYLVANDVEAHESISDGSVSIIVEDPEQQPIADLIQNWFNEAPKENYELFDPIIRNEGTLFYLPLIEKLLSIIRPNIILSR